MIPSKFLLDPDSDFHIHIYLERRDYKKDSWAICSAFRECWDKSTKKFIYEPSPSNRDEEFLTNCRFTYEEALEEIKLYAPAKVFNSSKT